MPPGAAAAFLRRARGLAVRGAQADAVVGGVAPVRAVGADDELRTVARGKRHPLGDPHRFRAAPLHQRLLAAKPAALDVRAISASNSPARILLQVRARRPYTAIFTCDVTAGGGYSGADGRRRQRRPGRGGRHRQRGTRTSW